MLMGIGREQEIRWKPPHKLRYEIQGQQDEIKNIPRHSSGDGGTMGRKYQWEIKNAAFAEGKLSTRDWGCATALSAIIGYMGGAIKNDSVLQRPP